MPLYDYLCPNCCCVSEKRIRSNGTIVNEEQALVCPKCNKSGLRRLSPWVSDADCTPVPAVDDSMHGQAVAPPVLGIWDEKEPDDDRFPVDHTIEDSWTGYYGWGIDGASQRGRLHAHEGKYREDAYRIEVHAGWHLVALADGAGSASMSRAGANRAVEEMVLQVSTWLDRHNHQADEETMRFALVDIVEKVATTVREEASSFQVGSRDMATTLIMVAHKPNQDGTSILCTVQIGDGLIAGWRPNEVLLFGSPESGEFAGETQFLTYLTKREQFDQRVLIEKQIPDDLHYLMLMSDGISDDFYPPEQQLVRLVEHLPDIISLERSHNIQQKELQELIGYSKRGSADDRTIVVLAAPIAFAARSGGVQ